MNLQPGDLRTIIDWVLLAIIVALLLILAPEVEALDDNSAVPVLLYHSRTAEHTIYKSVIPRNIYH